MRSVESWRMRRLYSLIAGSLARSSALGVTGAVGLSQAVVCGTVFPLPPPLLIPEPAPESGPDPDGTGVGPGPPKKEKSLVIEDDSHGTCSPRVAATTPA